MGRKKAQNNVTMETTETEMVVPAPAQLSSDGHAMELLQFVLLLPTAETKSSILEKIVMMETQILLMDAPANAKLSQDMCAIFPQLLAVLSAQSLLLA